MCRTDDGPPRLEVNDCIPNRILSSVTGLRGGPTAWEGSDSDLFQEEKSDWIGCEMP